MLRRLYREGASERSHQAEQRWSQVVGDQHSFLVLEWDFEWCQSTCAQNDATWQQLQLLVVIPAHPEKMQGQFVSHILRKLQDCGQMATNSLTKSACLHRSQFCEGKPAKTDRCTHKYGKRKNHRYLLTLPLLHFGPLCSKTGPKCYWTPSNSSSYMLCIVTKKEKGGTISSAELIEKAIESEREVRVFVSWIKEKIASKQKVPRWLAIQFLPQIN